MAHTKEEYLIEKGLLPPKGLDQIFFAYFNKDTKEIKTFFASVWDVQIAKGSICTMDVSRAVWTPYERKKYVFKCAPYEMTFNDEDTEGETLGMASGFGDLLRWAYYGYKDPKEAQKKYEDLLEESKEWNKPQKIIMPCG